ncbi:hypothetical protein E2562_023369 [Oryza meyeriana var. granulata]|uniref:DUF4378 domain-containing protein n=1 Tax=Oryza meyeriana var. granulata TaxID=110450 RepID=A0A6G1E2X4_9ORYZ|nr:hypothetical protein E2562_023369 [Oryza meyeriana var. granulata]KAF0918294.1 hypothetical protein E2562_023369 [Oryza meyeriana var. granulata]
MAQLLHHQESTFYGKELHGRRWSILQFFGFRRRLRSPKMISDKKHSQGKGNGGSRHRGSYVPLKDEDSGFMDDEKYTEATNKNKASKKSSGKGSLGSLILKKLYGKEGQKEKMLPVAPKLLRTLSIHYLESNEYVLDDKSASSGDGSSQSTTLSMQNPTDTNVQHATSNAQVGCENDTSSLLLKRGDSHVKQKSHRSISMDGVLHKVPYGQRVSGDVIKEGISRSASATYDRDGLKPYIGNTAKRPVNQGFRRSRSLTESLESYSHLLDSISSSQSKKTLTSSKSTRDNSLDGPAVMTGIQSSVMHAENLVIQEHALAPDVLEKTVVDGDVDVAMDENTVLFEDYIDDNKCGVSMSIEANVCTPPLPSEVIDISQEQLAACDDDQVPSSTEDNMCSAHSTSEEVDAPEEHGTTCNDDHTNLSTEASMHTTLISEDGRISEETSTSDDKQIHSPDVLKSREGTFYVPDPSQEIEAEINLSCEQETDSPMSVLDVTFPDDPASPVKYTILDDSSLKPRILHLSDTDDSADIGLNASTSMELSTTDLSHKNVQESDFDELNSLQADPKNEDELIYVKDIFMKSSFRNEVLFDEWYSQNITALQEEDCQHYEAAAAAFDFTEMSADQLLLSDLTNEVLLDIYNKYSASKSKLSRFSSFDRPKPLGNHALKELWSKVSRYLDEQPQSSIEIDAILSNDLAKRDRWVNFQRDADHLGNMLADFVFDKLLTEFTLQLAKF